MKRIEIVATGMLIFAGALATGCSTMTTRPAPAAGSDATSARDAERDEVRAMARDTLQQLYALKPEARRTVEGAYGYAAFSNFGLQIVVAGGGSGKGVAVTNATRKEIFMRMAEVQAGLGLGAKRVRVVWVFGSQQAFDDFVNKGYEFGGQATLAAAAGGKGAEVSGAMSVSPGVWLYQMTEDGLAAELTVKGSKFYRDKDLD